jgi:hypothetical protein
VDVGEAVIGGAEATGLPLFAAWRTIRRAADTPGHAAQVLHLLREHRGSIHVLAVAATGLTPLQAIVVSGGQDRARQLGFTGELPQPQAYRARWERAESITRQRAADAYRRISPADLSVFGEALESCRARLER